MKTKNKVDGKVQGSVEELFLQMMTALYATVYLGTMTGAPTGWTPQPRSSTSISKKHTHTPTHTHATLKNDQPHKNGSAHLSLVRSREEWGLEIGRGKGWEHDTNTLGFQYKTSNCYRKKNGV